MNRVVPVAMESCPILFHCLVPGGRWHTEMDRPLSVANLWSSHFHSRVRAPLLPPESAVISSTRACGYARRPIVRHHRRMLLTANAAVSWSMPMLTHPAFLVKSATRDGCSP